MNQVDNAAERHINAILARIRAVLNESRSGWFDEIEADSAGTPETIASKREGVVRYYEIAHDNLRGQGRPVFWVRFARASGGIKPGCLAWSDPHYKSRLHSRITTGRRWLQYLPACWERHDVQHRVQLDNEHPEGVSKVFAIRLVGIEYRSILDGRLP